MKKTYAIRIFGYNLLNLFKSFFWKGFFVVPFFRAIQFLRPNATYLFVYNNNIIPIMFTDVEKHRSLYLTRVT